MDKQSNNLLKNSSYQKLVVFVFLCSSAAALFQPFQSVFLKEVKGATTSQIGRFIALNSCAGILFSSIFAKISDKKNKRKMVLSIGIICAIIGYFFYIYIEKFYLLQGCSLIFMGISSLVTAQMFAFAKDFLSSETECVESHITFLRTVVSFAWGISPIIASLLVKIPYYKGILLGTVVLYVFAFIMLNICWKQYFGAISNAHIDKENESNGSESYIYFFINFIVFTILETINVIANVNIPLWVTTILQYDSKYIGMLTGFSALIEIPCMLALAYITFKKISVNSIIVIGISSGVLFFGLLKHINNIKIIFLIFIFKALFNAIYKGIGISLFQKMIPNGCGIATTLFTNSTRMGTIIGGFLTSSVGSYDKDFFSLAEILGIISVGIYICTWQVYKYLKKKENIK